ncbi:unnamed protein product [Malus baccata var. baccata]
MYFLSLEECIQVAPVVHWSTVWYVGRDGTEWDEAFRPTFGAPKIGGTRYSTGRILGEFSFRPTPWNDSFHIRGTQTYNISVSFFFLLVSIR